MADIEHSSITDPNIHEPKGAAGASAGQIMEATGTGSTQWVDKETSAPLIGFFDYNDAATSTTPLTYTTGGADLILTNDAAGPFTNTSYGPEGVTAVWDTVGNTFDWTQLEIGDMIDLRVDLTVATTVANQEVLVYLELGTGAGTYQIPFIDNFYKTAGTYGLNRFNGIYMGDSNTLDNGGVFRLSSDAACDVTVNGWYCKVIKRRDL